jgi:Holliday junction resolvasome RuvABC endonuclease subunit
MKIMGIDPSLVGCGLALLIDGQLKVAKTISTPPVDIRGHRLAMIANGVLTFYREFEVETVAMEGYAFGSPFNREEMGEVGGVIKMALYGLGIEPLIWPNTSWKKAVLGKGNVKKEDLKLPVFQKYGVEIADMNQLEAFCVAQAEYLAQTGAAPRPIAKPKKGRRKS